MAPYPQYAPDHVSTGEYGQISWIGSRRQHVPLALHHKAVYNASTHSCLTFTMTHRRSHA
jgi:hypothetical protein